MRAGALGYGMIVLVLVWPTMGAPGDSPPDPLQRPSDAPLSFGDVADRLWDPLRSSGGICPLDCLGVIPLPRTGDLAVDLLPREMKYPVPVPDVDADGVSDFWLTDYYVNEDRRRTHAVLHSGATGAVLREHGFAGSWVLPMMYAAPGGELGVLTDLPLGEGSVSLFHVFYDRQSYSDSCGGFLGWSKRLLAVDDETGAVLWERDYPIEVGENDTGTLRGVAVNPLGPFPQGGSRLVLGETEYSWDGCIHETGVYSRAVSLVDLESGATDWVKPMEGLASFKEGLAYPEYALLPASGGSRIVTVAETPARVLQVRGATDFEVLAEVGAEELGVGLKRVETSILDGKGVALIMEPGDVTAAAAVALDGSVLWSRLIPGELESYYPRLGLDATGAQLWQFRKPVPWPEDTELFGVSIRNGTEVWRRPGIPIALAWDPPPNTGTFELCTSQTRLSQRALDVDLDGTADVLRASTIRCPEYEWVVPGLVYVHTGNVRLRSHLYGFAGATGVEILNASFPDRQVFLPFSDWMWGGVIQSARLVMLERTVAPEPETWTRLDHLVLDVQTGEWSTALVHNRTYVSALGLHEELAMTVPITGEAGVERHVVHWSREEYPLLLWGTLSYARHGTIGFGVDPVAEDWRVESQYLDPDSW